MAKTCTASEKPASTKESVAPEKKTDFQTLCAGNPKGLDKKKCALYHVLSKLASKGKKE